MADRESPEVRAQKAGERAQQAAEEATDTMVSEISYHGEAQAGQPCSFPDGREGVVVATPLGLVCRTEQTLHTDGAPE